MAPEATGPLGTSLVSHACPARRSPGTRRLRVPPGARAAYSRTRVTSPDAHQPPREEPAARPCAPTVRAGTRLSVGAGSARPRDPGEDSATAARASRPKNEWKVWINLTHSAQTIIVRPWSGSRQVCAVPPPDAGLQSRQSGVAAAAAPRGPHPGPAPSSPPGCGGRAAATADSSPAAKRRPHPPAPPRRVPLAGSQCAPNGPAPPRSRVVRRRALQEVTKSRPLPPPRPRTERHTRTHTSPPALPERATRP